MMANARNSGGRPVSTAVSHVGIRPTVPNVSRGRWLAAGGLWVYALVLAVWLAAYWRESETARVMSGWGPGARVVGGTLRLESPPGGGTRVVITVPVRKLAAFNVSAASDRNSVPASIL
jgi:hypothetical protein